MQTSRELSIESLELVENTCLCLAVQRASRAVGRRFDEAFRPLNLTNWQFSLLMNTYRSEPPTISEIAHELATDRTTVTANLKPLERRGLVEVRLNESDRRSRQVVITKAGKAVLVQAIERWRKANATVVDSLCGTNIGKLHVALRTMSAS